MDFFLSTLTHLDFLLRGVQGSIDCVRGVWHNAVFSIDRWIAPLEQYILGTVDKKMDAQPCVVTLWTDGMVDVWMEFSSPM